MMTDPIADMLARIRNAGHARHSQTTCPRSNVKAAIAKVLSDEGFIESFETDSTDEKKPSLILKLRYQESGELMIEGLKRISKPGRRVYVAADEVAQVRSGIGMSILSTSKGVCCDRDARAAGVGGEVLCEVW